VSPAVTSGALQHSIRAAPHTSLHGALPACCRARSDAGRRANAPRLRGRSTRPAQGSRVHRPPEGTRRSLEVTSRSLVVSWSMLTGESSTHSCTGACSSTYSLRLFALLVGVLDEILACFNQVSCSAVSSASVSSTARRAAAQQRPSRQHAGEVSRAILSRDRGDRGCHGAGESRTLSVHRAAGRHLETRNLKIAPVPKSLDSLTFNLVFGVLPTHCPSRKARMRQCPRRLGRAVQVMQSDGVCRNGWGLPSRSGWRN
jgi:hypothetical protein